MDRMFVHPSGAEGERGARLMAKHGVAMVAEAVELLGVEDPGARVLEIGFGPGLGLAALAGVVREGVVVGVDPSPLMRRHASRRNANAIAEGRIVVLDGSAESLPLGDESIDAAMMIDNLHFWPDPIAGLLEVMRVLRPGSPVVCAFTPPSGGPPSDASQLFRAAGFVDVSERNLSEGYLLRAVSPVVRFPRG